MVKGDFYTFLDTFFPRSLHGAHMRFERFGDISIFPSTIWLVFICQEQYVRPFHTAHIPFTFANKRC